MSVGALAVASFAMGAMQSLSTYSQGQFGQEMANRQAQIDDQNAQIAQQQAGMQIASQDYQAEHQLAAVKASTAASGIVAEEGSPKLVATTSANQQEINDMYTKYAANIQSSNYYAQAALTKAMGQQGATAADISAGTGLISSGIGAYSGYTGGFGGGSTNWSGTLPRINISSGGGGSTFGSWNIP
jgi:hypothetical protein